jgi:hypothetical protein
MRAVRADEGRGDWWLGESSASDASGSSFSEQGNTRLAEVIRIRTEAAKAVSCHQVVFRQATCLFPFVTTFARLLSVCVKESIDCKVLNKNHAEADRY